MVSTQILRSTLRLQRALAASVLFGSASVVVAITSACDGQVKVPIPGGGGDPSVAVCLTREPEAGVTPLRRLTRDEYNNVVRDLLGDTSRPADAFAADEVVAGFRANVYGLINDTQLQQYWGAGQDLARETVANRLDDLTSCDLTSVECAHGLIRDLAGRAFRRPLDEATEANLLGLYDDALSEWDASEAMELAIQSILLSPQFLYHVEQTPAVPGEKAVLLDGFDMAARLSFFLWQSVPDDELIALAKRDELQDPEVLRAQAERMLTDDKAGQVMASFASQWLEIDGANPLSRQYKSLEAFPTWTPELAHSMQREAEVFVDNLIRSEDGVLSDLFLADYSFVDSRLAEVYGVEPPEQAFSRVTLPENRVGVLTQPGFLAAHAHAADVSWVLRGKFVREKMLCEFLPPPPADVESNAPNDPSRLTNSGCKGCHLLMDPIGYGFDGFDGMGATILDDTGAPFHAMGTVNGGGATQYVGEFDSIRQLGTSLVATEQVSECFVNQWLQFATHRDEQLADSCSEQILKDRFKKSGSSLRELVIDVVLSDAFRYRGIGENQ